MLKFFCFLFPASFFSPQPPNLFLKSIPATLILEAEEKQKGKKTMAKGEDRLLLKAPPKASAVAVAAKTETGPATTTTATATIKKR